MFRGKFRNTAPSLDEDAKMNSDSDSKAKKKKKKLAITPENDTAATTRNEDACSSTPGKPIKSPIDEAEEGTADESPDKKQEPKGLSHSVVVKKIKPEPPKSLPVVSKPIIGQKRKFGGGLGGGNKFGGFGGGGGGLTDEMKKRLGL